MWDEYEEKITFIDPYEENIIDSCLCDYSQILQSCHGNYEMLLSGKKKQGSGVSIFYNKFLFWLNSQYVNDVRVVDLFEISQFIRMLPFKKQALQTEQVRFFYNHAHNLFAEYLKKWNGE